MPRGYFFSFFFVYLCSCTNAPYRGCDVLGADEFVVDSYKIKEGKFAILEMEGKEFEPLATEHLEEYKDLVYEGDVLQISIYHPSRADLAQTLQTINCTLGFQVSQGTILLPDLEPICVKGLTLDEVRLAIQKAYSTYFSDITVFVGYKNRVERKVELAGLVSISSYPVNGKLRLFEVLAKAAAAPHANFFKSYVVRNGKILPVDLYKLVKEGDMSQNIVMQGGDKIYIADPSASKLMVLGEVGQNRVIDIPNGFMTLRQAIGEAGGIPYTGDRRYIQIFRGNLICPKIYTLNWQHLIHLPSDSLLLIPGDIVYIAATPIAEWNRFVNQVLPTLIGFDLITKGIKSIGVNVGD
ncbi:MAG: polysaccharide biosynthesis/export family protein [Chlamydiae bacterium]|nr:polysaccharide biosynthesis/export family protein [Chlamydiota bacterium]